MSVVSADTCILNTLGEIKDPTLQRRTIKKYEKMKAEEIARFIKAGMSEDDAKRLAIHKFATRIKVAKSHVQAIARQAKRTSELKADMIDRAKAMGVTEAQAGQELLNRADVRASTVAQSYLGKLSKLNKAGKMDGVKKLRDTDTIKDVIRELRGEGMSGTAKDPTFVKEASTLLREILDDQHSRLNNAGATMGFLDNYTPQTHNRRLISKVDANTWIGDIEGRLDHEKFIDPLTGMRATPERRREMLTFIFKEITEGRSVSSGKSGAFSGPDLNMRRNHSRFLHFKDASNFLEYNNKFGVGDEGLFNSLMAHVTRNGRDIGVMEVLGPRPRTFRVAVQKGWHQGMKGFTSFNGMARELLGENGYVQDSGAQLALSAVKNTLRSALLGGAPISALTDSAYVATGARMRGLNSVKAMGNWTKELAATGSHQQKNNAVATATRILNNFSGGDRLGADGFLSRTDGATQRLSDFTMKWSGLDHITESTANAFSLTMASDIGAHVADKRAWNKLPDALVSEFKRWRISEEEWGRVLQMTPSDEYGGRYMSATRIWQSDPKVGAKFLDMEYAGRAAVTNIPDLKYRAVSSGRMLNMEGAGGIGTFGKAGLSVALMFKSFPIQVLRNFTLPLIKQSFGQGDKSAMITLGGLAFMTTLLGGAVIQLKQIAKNREPREDWGSPSFIRAAMFQGGFAGLAGDFALADNSHYGRKPLTEMMVGPVFSVMDSVTRVAITGPLETGLFDERKDYDAAEHLAATVGELSKYAPGQTWYIKPLWRSMMGYIENEIDPTYERRLNRRIVESERELGSGALTEAPF